MSYIGSTPVTQSFIAGTDYFNGNGSTTAFTLSRSVVSVNDIQATVNNVVQQPNDAYTVSGNTITFTSAPSAGTGNVYVRYLSTTTQSITPSQGTVGWAQLNSDVQQDLGISFKNRIINGAMVLDQRNAGASVTPANDAYTLDRWQVNISDSSKFTIQQNAGSVTPPAGFTNYLGVTSSSAFSLAAGSYFVLDQKIEGFNIADLGWGTANAKTVTLSFWVRSSLTGTFGGVLRNSAENRSYPYTYTISAANTWEQKSVTITGDTSGTWVTTNGNGIYVGFGLGVGSTYSGTAGAWAGSTYASATGATSIVSTNGATFYLTGVQLEVGTQATTFDYRSIGTELALCQRYYFKSIPLATPPGAAEGPNLVVQPAVTVTLLGGWAAHKVSMRAQPSITVYNQFGTINSVNRFTDGALVTGTMTVPEPGSEGFRYLVNASNSFSAGTYYQFYYTASAEL
jgi:hypothetical protein